MAPLMQGFSFSLCIILNDIIECVCVYALFDTLALFDAFLAPRVRFVASSLVLYGAQVPQRLDWLSIDMCDDVEKLNIVFDIGITERVDVCYYDSRFVAVCRIDCT